MNFKEALHYLDSRINYEKGFEKYMDANYDPRRVGVMLEQAGLNSQDIHIIHIAGTKGKGSTAHYLARLLEYTQEKKVGLYTSPHIFKINERIVVQTQEIKDDEFASLVTEFQALIESANPTYFDALTFLAMVYFIRKQCGYVVLETGLGGRLDSTNFCDPALSIITTIGYDHTSLLGKTLGKIAFEKAGIIKPGRPVLTSKQSGEAMRVIKNKAKELQSPLFSVQKQIKYQIRDRGEAGSVVSANLLLPDGKLMKYHNLRLAQIGDVFVENFLLALYATHVLGLDPQPGAITQAGYTKIPYRMEKIGHYLFDVSHNDSSFRALFQTIKYYLKEKKTVLYIGILADKELDRIAKVIIQYRALFQRIVLFDFEASRKSGALVLKEKLKMLKTVEYQERLHEVDLYENVFYVFTGSFYMIDKALKLIKP